MLTNLEKISISINHPPKMTFHYFILLIPNDCSLNVYESYQLLFKCFLFYNVVLLFPLFFDFIPALTATEICVIFMLHWDNNNNDNVPIYKAIDCLLTLHVWTNYAAFESHLTRFALFTWVYASFMFHNCCVDSIFLSHFNVIDNACQWLL